MEALDVEVSIAEGEQALQALIQFTTRLWPFRNRAVADQATASRPRPEIR